MTSGGSGRKVGLSFLFCIVLFVAISISPVASYLSSTHYEASSSDQCVGALGNVREWTEVKDGSSDLLDADTFRPSNSDFVQPCADLIGLSYGQADTCIFFKFELRGKIPDLLQFGPTAVLAYQVLVDVDGDSRTGISWSATFTPDYLLDLEISPKTMPGVESVSFSIFKYSGSGKGNDWNWTRLRDTQRSTPLSGGLGEDHVVLGCRYQDIGASGGQTVVFIARSAIRFSGSAKTYNDYVPDSGILKATIAEARTRLMTLLTGLLVGTAMVVVIFFIVRKRRTKHQ